MRTKHQLTVVGIILLALACGCGEQPAANHSAGGGKGQDPTAVGAWELTVDIDHAALAISPGIKPSGMTLVDGHTVEAHNSPAGCVWDAGATTLTCEVLFKNLDANECMRDVRTRIHASTNPSAILTGADYIWPGPTVNPNTAQPINESGYCITETSPDSAGSLEGCGNTWQDNIPPGAIATQTFVFTNVPAGQYTFYLQVFATYQACSAPAGMARIPAGCFDMGDGSDSCSFDANECPVHNVCLTSDFYLGQHEVTNAEYAACVTAGSCVAPGSSASFTRASYYGNPTYAGYPVISVNLAQAAAYCAWVGGRLPTEAEWEYAARGGLARARYPWANAAACSDANYGRNDASGACWDFGGLANDTQVAASYAPNGYGLYDMSGNVSEWVNDWWLDTYYGDSPVNDPSGPASGTLRIFRGGAWTAATGTRNSTRYSGPSQGYSSVGFRCAEATPDTKRPTVIFNSPPNSATNVPFNSVVTATFSEAMDPATIVLPGTFTLMAGVLPVAGTVSYVGLMATFTPAEPLAPLTTYTATITTAAKDLAGNGLLTNYVWSFTTAALVGNSPAPVTLNAAAHFAILAGSALTDTPTSAITGDVGLTPTTGAAITGFSANCDEITGTVYAIDALVPPALTTCTAPDAGVLLTAAKDALRNAFNDAAGRSVPTVVAISGDLGGTTLYPGIYKAAAGIGIGVGNLTLDAQGNPNAVWIFQIGSTLITTAPGGNVALINGANPANVFWQVGSSATIAAGTEFNGTILAAVSISVGSGAQIHGRLLAGAQPSGAGAITLVSDTIIKP